MSSHHGHLRRRETDWNSKMKLLVLVESSGDSFPLDLSGDMKIEDAAALLEAEVRLVGVFLCLSAAELNAGCGRQTGLAVNNQILSWNGQKLQDRGATLDGIGVKEHDMLLLSSVSSEPPRQPPSSAPSPSHPGLPSEAEAEMIRTQLIGNQTMMQQLRSASVPSAIQTIPKFTCESGRQAFPEMAQAATDNPTKFRQLLPQLAQQQNEAARQRERNIALL